MSQRRKHKDCVQGIINKTKSTHNCTKEHIINRNGDFHFLDVVGFPHADKKNFWKPFAAECENKSSNLQRQSNQEDVLEFKRRYPESEVFQVDSAEKFDTNKLRKFGRFRRF
ncbi:MAG: hypothetical protein ABH864_05200 [archaeon]